MSEQIQLAYFKRRSKRYYLAKINDNLVIKARFPKCRTNEEVLRRCSRIEDLVIKNRKLPPRRKLCFL